MFEFRVREIRNPFEMERFDARNLYKEETYIDGTGRVSNKHNHQIFYDATFRISACQSTVVV